MLTNKRVVVILREAVLSLDQHVYQRPLEKTQLGRVFQR